MCTLKCITCKNSWCYFSFLSSAIHFSHPPTTSQNCSSSHLYLITAESAAVNWSQHTWCSFAVNTAELIFTLRMNWLRLKKKVIRTRAVRGTSQKKVKYYLWLCGCRTPVPDCKKIRLIYFKIYPKLNQYVTLLYKLEKQKTIVIQTILMDQFLFNFMVWTRSLQMICRSGVLS